MTCHRKGAVLHPDLKEKMNMTKSSKSLRKLLAATLPCLASSAFALQFHGLNQAGDTLVRFDQSGAVTHKVGVTGLHQGDALVDIDVFFSKDRQLYGLGQSGTLYMLDPKTGQATVDTANASVGSPVAIDFNPAADRLRIFSAGDANYRLTPGTGVVSNDGTLSFAAADLNAGANPNVRAGAYINNVDNPGTTTLFSIDADLNALLRHSGGPQFSTLNTVTGLTLGGNAFDIGAAAGFDIFSLAIGNNSAFVSNGNDLYQLNLGTGQLTPLGMVNTVESLRSIAVAGVPDAGSALPGLAMAMGGLCWLRAGRNRTR